MASASQEKIYETFAAVSGGQSPDVAAMIDASEQMAESVKDVASVVVGGASKSGGPGAMSDAESVRSLAEAVAPRGEAANATSVRSTAESVTSTVLQTVFGSSPVAGVVQSAVTGASSSGGAGGGIGSTLESIATTVLKSGLGIVPLIGGLLGLFGADSSTPAAPVKYQMPASIGFEGADTGTGVAGADYDQMGMARSFDAASAPGYGGAPAMSTPAPVAQAAAGATAPSAPQQITVNVQAMDARSFMDRSNDIAAAVRDAILNSNAINDAISEI